MKILRFLIFTEFLFSPSRTKDGLKKGPTYFIKLYSVVGESANNIKVFNEEEITEGPLDEVWNSDVADEYCNTPHVWKNLFTQPTTSYLASKTQSDQAFEMKRMLVI